MHQSLIKCDTRVLFFSNQGVESAHWQTSDVKRNDPHKKNTFFPLDAPYCFGYEQAESAGGVNVYAQWLWERVLQTYVEQTGTLQVFMRRPHNYSKRLYSTSKKRFSALFLLMKRLHEDSAKVYLVNTG